MPSFHYLLIFLSVLFFSLGHVFGTLAILARTSGIIQNKPYIAHSIEKIVAMIGLLCLATFVPITAYLTETVFSTNNIIFLCAVCQTVAFIMMAFLYAKKYRLINFFANCGIAYEHDRHIFRAAYVGGTFSELNLNVTSNSRFNLRLACIGLVANLFLASGFFVGFYLAGIFSDNRLTLSQASIFLNGIGTLITNLYGDSALARKLERSDSYYSWSETLSSYLAGRLIGHALIALIAYYFY